MKDNTLLVEKYRPTVLQDYVGNENVKNTIQKYLDQNDIQNFIFYGPAGTGKTTLAKSKRIRFCCLLEWYKSSYFR